jgi:putative peptidoglycan lipid II flippase
MPQSSPDPAPGRGHAILVAAGILLSRIAGLVRERVFAHYLGNSEVAGAFRAAIRIPNFLQNLFGEGVLSASFIPVYSRLLAHEEPELAGRVAGVVASVLALAVSLMVALGVWLTPAFVDLVAPGFHGDLRALTVTLVRIIFPGAGLLVLSAWCLGVLNSHRKFFLSYVAPVFWNVAMIATLIVCGHLGYGRTDLSVALAWATVGGSVLQFGVQVPFVLRYALNLRLGLDPTLAPVREVFHNLGPVVLSRGVVQLSAYIDSMIASYLGAAAVSGLGYAQTLYLLPISLFGMSVAAAELPEMAGTVGTAETVHAKLRQRLQTSQRQIAFLVIPSVMAFLLLGHHLVGALFQTGEFGRQDTYYVWYILMGSTVGLLAATWGRLYSSTFYALSDTRTPLKFAVLRVILTAVLGVLFAFPLRPLIATLLFRFLHLVPSGGEMGLGAVGLTASAGIAAWLEFMLLKRALSRRIGPFAMPAADQALLWILALTAGGLAVALDALLGPTIARFLPVPAHLAHAGWAVAVFGTTYLGLAAAAGIPSLAMLRRRGGRST